MIKIFLKNKIRLNVASLHTYHCWKLWCHVAKKVNKTWRGKVNPAWLIWA